MARGVWITVLALVVSGVAGVRAEEAAGSPKPIVRIDPPDWAPAKLKAATGAALTKHVLEHVSRAGVWELRLDDPALAKLGRKLKTVPRTRTYGFRLEIGFSPLGEKVMISGKVYSRRPQVGVAAAAELVEKKPEALKAGLTAVLDKLLATALPPPPAPSGPVLAFFPVEISPRHFKKAAREALERHFIEKLLEYGGFTLMVGKSHFSLAEELQLEMPVIAADFSLSSKVSRVRDKCLIYSSVWDLRKSVQIKAATRKVNCDLESLKKAAEEIAGILCGAADRR